MGKMSVIGKIVRMPLKLIPSSLKVVFLFGPLRGFKWITGASNHGYWLGVYEGKMKRYLLPSLKPGDAMLDLGAHVGYYSLIGARKVQATGKVYAFEPLPRNIGYLKDHLKLNDVENVVLYEGAIGHFDGYFNLTDNSPVGAKLSENGRLKVRVYSLKNLLQSKAIPIPQVIKMDIEGAEYELLNDLKDVLKDQDIKIFLSTHGKDIHRKCLAMLTDLGYSFIPLDADSLDQCTELYCFKGKI